MSPSTTGNKSFWLLPSTVGGGKGKRASKSAHHLSLNTYITINWTYPWEALTPQSILQAQKSMSSNPHMNTLMWFTSDTYGCHLLHNPGNSKPLQIFSVFHLNVNLSNLNFSICSRMANLFRDVKVMFWFVCLGICKGGQKHVTSVQFKRTIKKMKTERNWYPGVSMETQSMLDPDLHGRWNW